MDMKKYDIIVLGGGPAGLTAAREMGKTGLKVLLIEKETIGCRARSWITWYSEIERSGYKGCVINKINTLSFSSFLGGMYDFTGAGAAVVNTKKLLLALKNEAQNAGVRVHENEKFLRYSEGKGPVVIQTQRAVYSAKYCVDAMGEGSRIQQGISGNMPDNSYMGCFAFELTGLNVHDISKAMIFDAAFPGKDYFWFIPYSKHEALAGCFTFERLDDSTIKRVKSSLDDYIKLLKLRGRIKKTIRGNIPLMERRYFRSGGILFCGDSISSPLPSSGFGLLRSMKEAGILARCVNKGFKTGNIRYEQRIIASRYPGYELHYLASEILKNMNDILLNKSISHMKDHNKAFIKDFLRGDDLSLLFVSQALMAIFRTFTLREIASMALRRDYKEFLLRAARIYPKATPEAAGFMIKELMGKLNIGKGGKEHADHGTGKNTGN